MQMVNHVAMLLSKQTSTWEALDGIKITGRHKLAGFLCFYHSEGDFMIINEVCVNDVAYGLFDRNWIMS